MNRAAIILVACLALGGCAVASADRRTLACFGFCALRLGHIEATEETPTDKTKCKATDDTGKLME